MCPSALPPVCVCAPLQAARTTRVGSGTDRVAPQVAAKSSRHRPCLTPRLLMNNKRGGKVQVSDSTLQNQKKMDGKLMFNSEPAALALPVRQSLNSQLAASSGMPPEV